VEPLALRRGGKGSLRNFGTWIDLAANPSDHPSRAARIGLAFPNNPVRDARSNAPRGGTRDRGEGGSEMNKWIKDRFGIGWTKWFVRSLSGSEEDKIPNRKKPCPICNLLHKSCIWCRYHLYEDRIQYKCKDCNQVWEEQEDEATQSMYQIEKS
jgi:hypothetical protein